MSPTLSTFLFELVNFLLLAGVLGWLLFTPVRRMIAARRAAEQKRADDLAACQTAADRLRVEWEEKNAAFEKTMAEARAARLADAEKDAAAIVARARQAADRERDHATAILSHIEEAQLERLAGAIAAASREAVTKLLALLEAPDLEAGLLRAACGQVKTIDARSLGDVIVESAVALDDQGRQAIDTALGGRAASTMFRVVPGLGAGVRVTTARGLIDATAAGVAAAAQRWLESELVVEPRTTSVVSAS